MRRQFSLLCAAISISILLFPLTVPAADLIKVGGTGSALETMRDIADIFEKENPGVKVTVLPSLGSTGGIKAVLAGAIDIAVSGRQLNDNERGAGGIEEQYAESPFVFVTNRKNVSNLTIGEIARIYEGKISEWPDGKRLRLILRPQRDTSSIILSGISDEMKEAADRAHERPGMIAAVTDQDNAEALEKTPDSFGAITLDQIISEKRVLKVIAIDGITPTVEALANGTYTVSKPYYIITTHTTSVEAKKFITCLFSAKGAEVLKKNGYLITRK